MVELPLALSLPKNTPTHTHTQHAPATLKAQADSAGEAHLLTGQCGRISKHVAV